MARESTETCALPIKESQGHDPQRKASPVRRSSDHPTIVAITVDSGDHRSNSVYFFAPTENAAIADSLTQPAPELC
jgi:hypothetical protein